MTQSNWYRKYRKHIKSREWQEFRRWVLELRGGRCERCASQKGLHIHHKHYRTMGHETPDDVEVICSSCHLLLHGREKSGKTPRIKVRKEQATAGRMLTRTQRANRRRMAQKGIETRPWTESERQRILEEADRLIRSKQ